MHHKHPMKPANLLMLSALLAALALSGCQRPVQDEGTTMSTETEDVTSTEDNSTEESSTEDSSTEESTTEGSTADGTTEETPSEDETTKPSVTEPSTTEPPTTEPPTTEPPTTEPPTTEPPTTEPPTTEPPTTEPPTTEPPTTEPPTTQPPSTEPPTTQPPTTEPPTTQPPSTEPPTTQPPTTQQGFKDPVTVGSSGVQNETGNLEDVLLPATPVLLTPVASGTQVKKNSAATIDYSNTKDGYVMVNYTATTASKLKVQVVGPTTTYTYNLTQKEWTVFPLSDGNGSYKIRVMENVVDNRYAQVLAVTTDVKVSDDMAPFKRPNQYVNYQNATNTINTAATLCTGKRNVLEKVQAVYNFVVNNISYDYDKAATVQSGYLPVLDQVLASRKGICFDYAALMTGMLRSQGIPCKLIVGYAGTAYHAWISVWSQETGWIEGAVYFNGTTWSRMDPTFVSTSQRDPSVLDFIANDKNYTTKYIY